MIHAVRLIIAATFIWFGIGQVTDDLYSAFSDSTESFRVSGVANIWASFCAPLVGIVLIIHVVLSMFNLENADKFFQRGILIVIFAVSPTLTAITKIKLNSKSNGYIECHDLRRVSRWNSYQVYAISSNECLLLKVDKK